MDQKNTSLNQSIEQADMIQKKESLITKQSLPDETGQASLTSGWFSFSNPAYLKGFLIAAGITLAVSNPKVRKVITDGAIKTWAAVQGGVEEFKEKIGDIRAEMSQEQNEPDEQDGD